MGKRGPRGKPTNLRVLHGDRKDRINTNEPIPDAGVPQPPYVLPDDVQEVWDYTVAQLRVMRCVTMADRDVLICYCEAVVTHRKASAGLAKTGVLIRTRRGDAYMRNPLLQVQRDAAATIRGFAQEFGLTPSARSEINMGGGAPSGLGAERLLT
jgi:P27 family predicted phage terminase small subunit